MTAPTPASRAPRPRPVGALGTPVLAALTAVAVVVAITVVIVGVQSDAHREEVAASLVREGGRMRADLERAVDVRIARTEALVGFATAEASDGEIDADAFERFATLLQDEGTVELRSLQLAPEAVVTYVHPLAGNEQAVGHDLLADPDRRAAVLATVEARRTMVAGPFELLQGGTAIVARAPVFVVDEAGDEAWWGLATVVADADPMFIEAGLDQVDVDVAVRGRDGLGADGDVFLGDPALFEQAADAELFQVTLPAGSWQLAVAPAGGWDAVVWPERTLTVVGMGALAVLLAALVYRLMANRQRVQRLLEDRAELVATASVPIVQVARDHTVQLWNDEASTVSGIAASTVIGRDVRDVLFADNGFVRAVAELVDETIRTGERVDGHVARVERTDGQELALLCNGGPITDAGGVVTDVVVVAQDVTAQAEADRIRRDHEALTATAKLKDEFLATMSHELRTPLNGILGLTQLLRDETAGELNETQLTYVDHTHEAGTHLLQLINDVLDMSRLDARDDDLELTAVDVRIVVERAVQMVASDAEERGLDLDVEVAGDLRVVADERRLVQVVLNLLGNAVKFTDDGSVSVRARADGDTVQIAVSDTGIGIAPEDRTRLFQPFVQLEASLDRRFEGSGLGLSLAQKLAAAFGGHIDVTSTPGEGSTFTVVLPRADAVTAAPLPETAAGPAPADGDATDARARVLVAEDNDINRLIATEFLGTLGYDHVVAINGAQAVEVTRAERPDLILMDIQMPTMDGLEATRILKADPATADIPVIAVTALAMEGDEERCRAAGCDGYLAKPIAIDDLRSVVQSLLEVPAAP